MNFQEYKAYFQSLLSKSTIEHQAPYDNLEYLDYTKLNLSRMNRWFKKGVITNAMLDTISKVSAPQQWIVITEPWRGDASHNIPFIEMTASKNPLVAVSYVLRDVEPYLIDKYLTNGTKSIPKLIIRDAQDQDLGTWGPRPQGCQRLYVDLLKENAPFEKVKVELQNWYNTDQGISVQNELIALITKTITK